MRGTKITECEEGDCDGATAEGSNDRATEQLGARPLMDCISMARRVSYWEFSHLMDGNGSASAWNQKSPLSVTRDFRLISTNKDANCRCCHVCVAMVLKHAHSFSSYQFPLIRLLD